MTRFGAKLGFVHRRLWQRDGTYRAAVLLGPAPLLGRALAAALWFGVHPPERSPDTGGPIPWAQRAVPAPPRTGQPFAVAPGAPLPAADAQGRRAGLEAGWIGRIFPVEVSPTLEVDILSTPLAPFTLDQASIDVAAIVAAGPATGLYAGAEAAVLAVRTAGRYAISARLDRTSPQPADCVVRLSLAAHRLVSQFDVGLSGAVSLSSEVSELDLQPGLYRLTAAFGCWHDGHVTGPGTMTVLIRHPGEQGLHPARADEIFRPPLKAP